MLTSTSRAVAVFAARANPIIANGMSVRFILLLLKFAERKRLMATILQRDGQPTVDTIRMHRNQKLL